MVVITVLLGVDAADAGLEFTCIWCYIMVVITVLLGVDPADAGFDILSDEESSFFVSSENDLYQDLDVIKLIHWALTSLRRAQ